MSTKTVLEKWNKKWKTQRLQILFSKLDRKAQEFLINMTIKNVKETNYVNDSIDNIYSFDLIIEVTHEEEMYWICKEEGQYFVATKGYDEMDYENAEDWAQFFKAEEVFEGAVETEHERAEIYNEKINELLERFPFRDIVKELVEEYAKEEVARTKEEILEAKCVDVVFEEKEQQYYIVFSNGVRLPYKTEDSQVANLEYKRY